MNFDYISSTVEETQKIAEEFVHKIKPGDVITLSGELGAGKTTFTQGFAHALGITHRIISPTFVIIRSYDLSQLHPHIKKFYHVDLYRIESENDLEGLGLAELLDDKEAVTVIEWPERMGSLTPHNRWDIRISPDENDNRKIEISSRQ